jgi:UDP-2-acetamido-2,6-beta-L-arabino-hexul-4-ose reductase
MIKVLVTGGKGFLGRNLICRLREVGGYQITVTDIDSSLADLNAALEECDVVFHLAGANRPADPADFTKTNRDLTAAICETLKTVDRTPKIVFSSSIQAELDNPYGKSKREAEVVLRQFAHATGAEVRIYRLRNLFGKWSRPNYNTVVATLCHNLAHDLPIKISDPNNVIDLVYVDDVVTAFLDEADGRQMGGNEEIPSYAISLGELAGAIQSFRDFRETLLVPDFSEPFLRKLYATYLSFVPDAQRESRLRPRHDQRGSLAEFLKSDGGGQIFISRTLPGVTRGNHYHHTKTERFFVVEGEGLLRMRQIESSDVVEYRLRGSEYQVVDIPPGFTHSIENLGTREMVTLFWASEIFNPDKPDTYYLPVIVEEGNKFEAVTE